MVEASVTNSGESLVYKRMGAGYLLYSVGSNRKDDGGKDKPEGEMDDIVVEVK